MINGIKPNIKSSTLNEVDKTKLGIPLTMRLLIGYLLKYKIVMTIGVVIG
tara:strand:+ start:1009 stop:1158 length:150 start_codon:yes stop_codon:yes gene_type:complete